jgi:DNA-binding transcriptional LysR family regulator
VVARTDAVAIVPSTFAVAAARVLPLRPIELPFALDPTLVSLAWHPRFDRDPAHVWLRRTLQVLLGALARASSAPGGR